MLENATRDVWRRSRPNMHEYGKNSEWLSGNLMSTYCITVTNNPISLGDLSVGIAKSFTLTQKESSFYTHREGWGL